MADAGQNLQASGPAASLEDQTLLVFARLMEGGQEDAETCRDLDQLTKLLNDDAEIQQKDKITKQYAPSSTGTVSTRCSATSI